MAGESNMGFQDAFGCPVNQQGICYQSGAMNSALEMIPVGSYYGFSGNGGVMLNNSGVIGNGYGMVQAGGSSGSLLLDSVPGLTRDNILAVEWSAEEQYMLEEGLVKYADEPSIMRHIKIAGMLRDKTVRDVALRCRWMTRKRRKADEHAAGKKVNSRKDKLVESSSSANIPSAGPMSMTPHSLLMHRVDQSERMGYAGISGPAKHLLEQNYQTFHQIKFNLSNYNLHDNIDLFCRTRSNIIAILNGIGDNMPGIKSPMPPLSVFINEDLANVVLPNTIQT